MSWFMLPAAIALIVKLWFLFTLKSRTWAGKRWAGLVAIFCVHNLSELLLLNSALYDGLSATFILRCYYACTSLVIVYCFIYVMDEKRYRWQMFLSCSISVATVLAIGGIFFSDYIIAGYLTGFYTATAMKGSWYILFQVYALLGVLSILNVLIFNFRKSQGDDEKTDYFYTLLAFVPLLLIGFIVVVLMMAGSNITAVMLIPIASTLMLIITLKGKKAALVDVDWRSYIPFTLEYKLRSELKAAQNLYIKKSNSHQQTMLQIEKALLEYQRDKHGGSIAKASKTIGIMRSTFYSKMNKFNKT